MEPVIEIEELEKKFGEIVALRGLDVNFYKGINGFLGPNGSGKTTTLKIILGLLKPDAGKVSVLGFDPTSQGIFVRGLVGYFPERDILDVDIEADKLVVHLGVVAGLGREEAIKRFNDIATLLDLGEEVHRPLRSLSHGMRQKIKLAVALIHDPEILLLDEPTSGLDPIARSKMLELIRLLWGELSISVVLSTHILRDVEAICDRFVVISEGRKVYEGPVSALDLGEVEEISVRFIDFKGSREDFVSFLRDAGYKVEETLNPMEIIVKVKGGFEDTIKDILTSSKQARVILSYVGGRGRRVENFFARMVD